MELVQQKHRRKNHVENCIINLQTVKQFTNVLKGNLNKNKTVKR